MKDYTLRKSLVDSIIPMSFQEVTKILECAYGQSHVFKELNKFGRTASLGQVHLGKLNDGTEVAVKIQYPENVRTVGLELDFMEWLLKASPVTKWDFKMDGCQEVFLQKLREELDNRIEIGHQIQYRKVISPLERIIIPEVIEDLYRPNILVQKREEGFGLNKAETMIPTQKQAMGSLLLEYFFHMLFRHGFVHADLQPLNLSFRQYKKDYFVLILCNFGSIFKIPYEMRLALLRIILALRNHENIDPVSCLSLLGFDLEQLEELRPTLPALLSVLFEPFIIEAPYELKDWRISERFDHIIGEKKWWFCSAAPPKLIFLMRTLHGMITMLNRLDVALPWHLLLDMHISDIYPVARELKLPKVITSQVTHTFNDMARYLKVHILKNNGNKVSITLPARCADDLQGVMDESVKESIEKQKIDLHTIQKKAQKSGFLPQTLFSLSDQEHDIKVLLE